MRNPDFLPHMWVYMASVSELFARLSYHLTKLGYTVELELGEGGKNFLSAIPPIDNRVPLMMVGHLDTVHHKLPTSKDIVIKDGVATASAVGLGADDRAGIAGILEILKRDHRPHILFTDMEEKGGIGAKAAAEKLIIKDDIRAIIELDRRDKDDCVFYDCNNPDFTKWVEGFGFKKAFGSYTDISSVCPRWGIAGVNLSIGYYGAHGNNESLKIAEWWATVDKVTKMMANPPEKQFVYIKNVYTGYAQTGYNDHWNGEDWSTYRNQQAAMARSKYSFDEIVVSVAATDLATIMGGDVKDYAAIIAEFKDEIEGATEDFIASLILEIKERRFQTEATPLEKQAAELAAISG